MRLTLLITLAVLCMAVLARSQTPFRDTFAGGKPAPGWVQHLAPGNRLVVTNGRVEIRARENTHAYFVRPVGADNVSVTARIQPSSPAGVTWSTSLFLWWGQDSWVQLGIVSRAEGHYYTVETNGGPGDETDLDRVDLTKPRRLKIELAADGIRYLASDDGIGWRVLRIADRPAAYRGAPKLFCVGKGYGRGEAPYANSVLANDYSEPGQPVVSWFSDVRIDRTPVSMQRLTKAERARVAGALMDPVGAVELAGTRDPIFRRVAGHFPEMRYPRELVGVPSHVHGVGVDHLGRLELNSDRASTTAPLGWLVMDGVGSFGGDGSGIRRRLVDGWKPIVALTRDVGTKEGRRYTAQQTVFGWSRGLSPTEPLVAYARLTVAGRPTSLPERATWVMRSSETRTTGLMSATAGGREICLRIPYDRPNEPTIITPAEFGARLSETRAFWSAYLASAAQVVAPEQKVEDAYRAWLAYAALNTHRINGFEEPHDGTGFYTTIFGYSAILYCHALDMYGLHARSERILDTFLHYQQPDGLYTHEFGLPDQGALLFALTEHYRMTRDRRWLRRVAPNVVRAVEWILARRAAAPTSGIAAGMIKYRPYCDYPSPTFNFMGDTYSCIGLEHAADLLDAADRPSDAARARAEAARYRADIRRSMSASAFRKGAATIVPMEPDTQRIAKQSRYRGGGYWGLVASCMLETEFLAPSDPIGRLITDHMERQGGLIAGLSEFAGGIDHAYTYGYMLTKLKRGDVRPYLLAFYGMLAYGMTRDTYAGVECTQIRTGENANTLPHLYSSTQQLRSLRMMLVREDGDTLRLAEATPRHWLRPGRTVGVRRAGTRFGPLTYTITSETGADRMSVDIDVPPLAPPKRIVVRLRHPDGRPIASVRGAGATKVSARGDEIRIDAPRGRIRLAARF